MMLRCEACGTTAEGGADAPLRCHCGRAYSLQQQGLYASCTQCNRRRAAGRGDAPCETVGCMGRYVIQPTTTVDWNGLLSQEPSAPDTLTITLPPRVMQWVERYGGAKYIQEALTSASSMQAYPYGPLPPHISQQYANPYAVPGGPGGTIMMQPEYVGGLETEMYFRPTCGLCGWRGTSCGEASAAHQNLRNHLVSIHNASFPEVRP
jgi:hypothetical protein